MYLIRTLPEGISKMLMMPSMAPEAMYFPSGEYAIDSVNLPRVSNT